MSILGNRLLEDQFGGGSLTYQLRDEFTTDRAAGSFIGTSADPGPGTRSGTDTDSKLSVSGGKRVLASGSSNNPREFLQVSRAAGRALFTQLNYSAAAIRIGYGDLTNADSQKRGAVYVNTTSSGVYDGSAVLITSILNLAINTDYQFCIVLLTTGEYYFVKGGVFTNWTLFWIGNVGTSTPLYAGINGHSSGGAGSSDYDRVRDLPAPFTGSIATLSVSSFTQSLGSELVSNGNMETGSPPTGYSAFNAAVATSVADERTGGSGSASLANTGAGTAFPNIRANWTSASNTIYLASGWLKNIDSLGANIFVENSIALASLFGNYVTPASWSRASRFFRDNTGATRTIQMYLSGANNGLSARFDDLSIKPVTLNTAQTMPADAIVDFTYALPATPAAGMEIHLLYRINSAGDELNNCWDAYLRRNDANSAWDFLLDSISSGTRTNRVSVTGVGSVTTIRIICEGNNHDCYLFASGAWAKRGSTVTNSSFASATGLNTLYSTEFTPSALAVYKRTDTAWSAELDRV